ncbi:hypothetical protein FRC08_003985 [Ceratobasidium sp. 394]|nr:hypothetical protein FRC08_003985 [Ceratobasidium sp. 394]
MQTDVFREEAGGLSSEDGGVNETLYAIVYTVKFISRCGKGELVACDIGIVGTEWTSFRESSHGIPAGRWVHPFLLAQGDEFGIKSYLFRQEDNPRAFKRIADVSFPINAGSHTRFVGLLEHPLVKFSQVLGHVRCEN